MSERLPEVMRALINGRPLLERPATSLDDVCLTAAPTTLSAEGTETMCSSLPRFRRGEMFWSVWAGLRCRNKQVQSLGL